MVEFNIKKVQLIESGAGIELYVNKHIYEAGSSGKTIYIQAGLHGGETSQWVLNILHSFLFKSLKRGEVHIVPYANPMAWMQRQYLSTNGKFSLIDGQDFNRAFSGDEHGSSNQRIAAGLMTIARNADLVIDLHTSKDSSPYCIFTKEKYTHLVKLCNLELNQFSNDAAIPSLQGTFNAALDREDIDNLCIECGSHNEYNETKIKAVYESLINLLSAFDMIDEPTFVLDDCFVFENKKKIFSPYSGLIKFRKKADDLITNGEIIATIFEASSLGSKIDIPSPVDGRIISNHLGHIVWEGDTIAEIVPLTELRPL